MGRPRNAFAIFKWLIGKPFFRRIFRFEQHTATIAMALIVGVLSSFAIIVFRSTLDFIRELIFIKGQETLQIGQELESRLLLPLIPVLGAIMLIPLKWKFPGEVGGYGFPNFLVNVNLRGGE
ncbi:MAG: hypothetical protein HQK89_12905 [Nitrospirae bacterium]|nr:hypothetical protein [Nitrospirota bacterium]